MSEMVEAMALTQYSYVVGGAKGTVVDPPRGVVAPDSNGASIRPGPPPTATLSGAGYQPPEAEFRDLWLTLEEPVVELESSGGVEGLSGMRAETPLGPVEVADVDVDDVGLGFSRVHIELAYEWTALATDYAPLGSLAVTLSIGQDEYFIPGMNAVAGSDTQSIPVTVGSTRGPARLSLSSWGLYSEGPHAVTLEPCIEG
jgi:hypothetical protein